MWLVGRSTSVGTDLEISKPCTIASFLSLLRVFGFQDVNPQLPTPAAVPLPTTGDF